MANNGAAEAAAEVCAAEDPYPMIANVIHFYFLSTQLLIF
jgi:hypothetical protein